jgi:hypothetical protein
MAALREGTHANAANTLFVQTQGAYLRKDHETVQVKLDGEVKLTRSQVRAVVRGSRC